jgi:hypothetical protein
MRVVGLAINPGEGSSVGLLRKKIMVKNPENQITMKTKIS